MQVQSKSQDGQRRSPGLQGRSAEDGGGWQRGISRDMRIFSQGRKARRERPGPKA